MVTTIQLSNELKEKIASFGSKNETYEKIIERLYDMACKEHLREFLMDDKDTISLDEFEREINSKWPESK
tara:strand:- start:66 stop:275 length:210 start_codon:yes stop_codon:yes gene_type:complete